MLVFVIPLKSSQVSKSWDYVSKIFERTLRSVCNQTSSDFRVIVVCNEKPRINFSHSAVSYCQVNFPEPNEPSRHATTNADKGRKILYGLVEAQKFSPTHTMSVDADDCVSKYLAEFVGKNPTANGWFVNKGYKYEEGSPYIYIKRNNFYRMCGTCNIIRYDLNNVPENPEYDRGYGYYKLFIDHAKVKDSLGNQGSTLKPLPFAGATYMIGHGENNYYSKERLSFNIFNRKKLSPSIQDEFGIYSIPVDTQKDVLLPA